MFLTEVTEEKLIKEFHKIPRIIYKNDSNWIPHIESDIEKKFHIKTNKLYDGNNAKRWIFTRRDRNRVSF